MTVVTTIRDADHCVKQLAVQETANCFRPLVEPREIAGGPVFRLSSECWPVGCNLRSRHLHNLHN